MCYLLYKTNRMKGFSSEPVVFFNFKKDFFFAIPFLQNTPYPQSVNQASRPSAYFPILNLTSFIYDREFEYVYF